MVQQLTARGRMGSYSLSESKSDNFYVSSGVDENNVSKSVSENLDDIQATMLNMEQVFSEKLKALEESMSKLEPFPVGSVFISTDNINPRDKIGYGNWNLTSGGRCLVGAGDGKVLGQTGGQRDIALSEAHMPHHSHDVAVHDLHTARSTTTDGGVRGTDAQGAHRHKQFVENSSDYFEAVRRNSGINTAPGTRRSQEVEMTMTSEGNHNHSVDINHAHTVDISHGHTVTQNGKGGNQAFNIENPYFVVNIWQRVS